MQRVMLQRVLLQRVLVQRAREQYERAKVKESALAKASLQGLFELSAELASNAVGDGQLLLEQQQLWALLFSQVELAPLI